MPQTIPQKQSSSNIQIQPIITNLDTSFVNRSQYEEYSDEEELEDEDKIYKLEIEQLKRENKFLKKKIHDLQHDLKAASHGGRKIFSKNEKNQQKQKQLSMQNSNYGLDYFVQEINKLLETLCQAFSIRSKVQNCENEQSRTTDNTLENIKQFNTKHKEGDFLKKLNSISLQEESKRYASLLEIFIDYHKTASAKDNYLRSKVNFLTEETIDLGKKVLDAASNRAVMKASQIRSKSIKFDYNLEQDLGGIVKKSQVKSSCVEFLDLGSCKAALKKDMFFDNIF